MTLAEHQREIITKADWFMSMALSLYAAAVRLEILLFLLSHF